jgi:hypothetical protein
LKILGNKEYFNIAFLLNQYFIELNEPKTLPELNNILSTWMLRGKVLGLFNQENKLFGIVIIIGNCYIEVVYLLPQFRKTKIAYKELKEAMKYLEQNCDYIETIARTKESENFMKNWGAKEIYKVFRR